MRRHSDIHVTRARPRFQRRRATYGGWTVMRAGRKLSTCSTQAAACRFALKMAMRNKVDLVIHGRDGRIRSKDSYGNEGPTRDTEH